jgi:hypothetical protein
LHSNVPKKYRYFAALLFDRWQVTVDKKSEKPLPISLNMLISRTIDGGQHGSVKIGDLYAEEERDFQVDVKLPVASCFELY